ncbi:HTH domain-containing protein [Haloarcula litorea]|uniref:HTH domain-containing protein n=1 Tax=Haloarcula litorea TaxID=3032579 RepID=UPI0023E793CE|nr:HTH domain-containing protein [Halomicroarcula sp. GDY20]
MQTECPTTRRAELFVRGDLPRPARSRRAAVESTLTDLRRRGVLDEVETTEWRKRVPLHGEGECRERELFNEFSVWARERDARLAPFFSTRECYSTTTGECRTELVLPALCLAVYEDGELARLAPIAADGRPSSVEDCLTDLAADRRTATETTTAGTAD